jgi:hypothetical protein
VIEKFVPFIIKGINWTVGSKTVTYDWDCGAIGQFVGVGRGEVPYDVQLVDSTVAGVLGGTVAADASDNRLYRQGTANTDQSSAETARLTSQEAALSRSNRENARSISRIARAFSLLLRQQRKCSLNIKNCTPRFSPIQRIGCPHSQKNNHQ